MDTSPATSTTSRRNSAPNVTTTAKPLSCSNCRQRKVKCNKVHPCGPCTKSGTQCVFPQRVRVPRVKPAGSRARDSELLKRIGRLEALVSSHDATRAAFEEQERDRLESSDGSARGAAATASPPSSAQLRPGPNSSGKQLASEFADFIKSQEADDRYTSSQFWTTLGNEVGSLRDLLEADAPEDDDAAYSISSESTTKVNSPSYLFNEPYVFKEVPQPSQRDRVKLHEYYFQNVQPMCHILHRGTTDKYIIGSSELLDSAGRHMTFPSVEATSMAVYFAAVTSMDDRTCREEFGQSRDDLINKYKHATEVSLGRANFLNSMEIVTLTAFVIYLIAARSSNSGRSVWTLVSLCVRIAQAMNLHRDGDGSKFDFFEAEQRRRVWWAIVVLDLRSAEDRGSEPVIIDNSATTILPTNINDEDMYYNMKGTVCGRQGRTEMCYSLMSADISQAIKRLNYIAPRHAHDNLSLSDKEQLITNFTGRVADVYTNGIDVSTTDIDLMAVLGRILKLRLWAVLQHPFEKQESEKSLVWPAGSALRTAVNILEMILITETHPDAQNFRWYFRTWVPWHPVAMALAELCNTPHGDLADRAWPVVEQGYHLAAQRVADSSTGMLWKPVRRLYRRAKALREGRSPFGDSMSNTPQERPTTAASAMESPIQSYPRDRNSTSEIASPLAFAHASPLTYRPHPCQNAAIPAYIESYQTPHLTPGLQPLSVPLTSYPQPVPSQQSVQPDYSMYNNGFMPAFGLDWMPMIPEIAVYDGMQLDGHGRTLGPGDTMGVSMNWDDWNDFIGDVDSINFGIQGSAVYGNHEFMNGIQDA